MPIKRAGRALGLAVVLRVLWAERDSALNGARILLEVLSDHGDGRGSPDAASRERSTPPAQPAAPGSRRRFRREAPAHTAEDLEQEGRQK